MRSRPIAGDYTLITVGQTDWMCVSHLESISCKTLYPMTSTVVFGGNVAVNDVSLSLCSYWMLRALCRPWLKPAFASLKA